MELGIGINASCGEFCAKEAKGVRRNASASFVL
jgi:hypothetical protein